MTDDTIGFGSFKRKQYPPGASPSLHDAYISPLRSPVNRSAKSFFNRQFTEWYSNEIKLRLEAGTKLDDIEVKLTLTALKPLHSTWIRVL